MACSDMLDCLAGTRFWPQANDWQVSMRLDEKRGNDWYEQVNMVNPICENCGGPHQYSECQAASGFNQGDVYAATRNYNAGGNSYQPQGNFPPPLPSCSSKEVEREPKPTMDQVHISSPESTTRVLSLVIRPAPISKSNEIPEQNTHQPPIPYPSRLNKDKLQDKYDIQIHKFLQMFKKLHFNISFAEALAHMQKYAKMLKDLLNNKEKLLEFPDTPLNENCSTVLLKKLPKKLRDPGKFLIPCDFSELEECTALADLVASINFMPLSVWKKLILPELIPTCMTLELANWSVAYPAGIAGCLRASGKVYDDPTKADKSEIYPLIGQPYGTFLMGDKEINFNPIKDIDEPVPIPRNKDSDES
nr:reverse transcriptase domain-containing protein [Tanacetum cinerariifolium]